MNPKVDLVLDCRNQVGESPVWVSRESALYWVDIPSSRLHRWAAGRHVTWRLPQMAGCIAPHASAGWVAGMQTGIFRLDLLESGECGATMLASVTHGSSMRFNDGRCDRQGRFLAGTMEMDMSQGIDAGVLYQVRQDGRLSELLSGFVVPNGLAFSPEGARMYVSDSHPTVRKIWCFDYDVQDGTLGPRELLVDMTGYAGRPDGAAVDQDGCYWICGNDGGVIYRFTPAGKLDRSIPLPVRKPAMCAFGGDQLDTLFITSIRPADADLSGQPLAGGLFALRPGTRGLPEPACLVPAS